MADHFEEVVGLRLTALETRAADEEKALKEYFVELQQFITSSLKTQADTLRTEWRSELRSGLDGVRSELSDLRSELTDVRSELTEVRLELTDVRSEVSGVRSELTDVRSEVSGVRSELTDVRSELNGIHSELNGIKGDGRRLDQRLESLEQKVDAHHAVTQTVLRDILRRLPPPASSLGV